MNLILASTSPRRRDLLRRLEIPFTVIPSEVVERRPLEGEPPGTYALALAREKAADVARRFPDALVIGADTVVTVDDLILGKPVDATDAELMLRLLVGRCHTVVTGVAIDGRVKGDGRVSATVCMRSYSVSEVRRYIQTGEPMDKAGAYAVQEYGGSLVEYVLGCYETVVGLPLCLVRDLLRGAGFGSKLPEHDCCTHRATPA